MIVYEIETGKDLGDQDTPKFLLPDHSAPKPGYIIKPIYTPDKKAVLGAMRRHRKIDGRNISIMNSTEQRVADEAPEVADLERVLKIRAVQQKTVSLIAAGFEYPEGSGNRLSLSRNAQSKIHGLSFLEPDDFPVSLSLVDETEYVVNNPMEAFAVQKAMSKRLNAQILSRGSQLKGALLDATTIDGVRGVTDSRI